MCLVLCGSVRRRMGCATSHHQEARQLPLQAAEYGGHSAVVLDEIILGAPSFPITAAAAYDNSSTPLHNPLLSVAVSSDDGPSPAASNDHRVGRSAISRRRRSSPRHVLCESLLQQQSEQNQADVLSAWLEETERSAAVPWGSETSGSDLVRVADCEVPVVGMTPAV